MGAVKKLRVPCIWAASTFKQQALTDKDKKPLTLTFGYFIIFVINITK